MSILYKQTYKINSKFSIKEYRKNLTRVVFVECKRLNRNIVMLSAGTSCWLTGACPYLYLSIQPLYYKAKIMSHKYVKFLLDVQGNVFSDVRSNMMTTFNKNLYEFNVNLKLTSTEKHVRDQQSGMAHGYM